MKERGENKSQITRNKRAIPLRNHKFRIIYPQWEVEGNVVGFKLGFFGMHFKGFCVNGCVKVVNF